MNSLHLSSIETNHLWADFHATFINYWRESLADSLPPKYEAYIGEQVSIVFSDSVRRRFGPDVSVIRSSTESYFVGNDFADTTTVCLDHLAVEEETRTSHIEIIHRPNRRLVAWLELLSPSNKGEPGRSRYLTKRNELLSQPVHLVELDLLLGGIRLPHQQPLPEADYYAIVSRVKDRFRCWVTAWRRAANLPSIFIPLDGENEFIPSALQSVFELVYARGRYADRIQTLD